ncbi:MULTISPECIES: aminoglycoside phosphotransferase family protein [Streptacidiphilus]|uniref:Aminoglycoside phosphotransferase family protein n=1 Tax=Streptacidiphilus cavernicola TaxID=3342716 RepID=A0ABV6UK56_9ACTN|nr:aminoglycoside phosphotransferase family protein [Streptacidiphilus jeojiense]
MVLQVDHLVELLGLGSAAGPATNLKPGDPNPVFAVDTERGPWVIKTLRPAGPWWFDRARRAASLEQAALAAGVAMPGVAPTVPGERIGMWTPNGDGSFARALIRIDGSHPTVPLAPEVSRWVGATLAALEAVAPPVPGAWEETGYPTYSAPEWAEWLDEAHTLGVLSSAQVVDAVHLIADLNERVESGIARRPGLKVLHRDVSPVNVLLTENGPQLLDFDSAGPQVPWWEAVGHFFALASPDLGRIEPDRRSIDAAVAGYRDGGGEAGPAEPEAFTGRLAADLSYAAFLLWNACGHRGGDAAWHLRCAHGMRKSLRTLSSICTSAQRWSTWLR